MYTPRLLVSVFILALIWIACSQCANPLPIQGGPKDETPPQIDSTKTTPNFQTNFVKQRIEITFDEWIKLDKVSEQVVISPPLEHKESITLKGKTIRFEFDEDEILKDSVTYTINFGDAIQDITEGNALSNYRFVFSTGAYIDSLEVQGIVKDAFSEELVDGATILLYDQLVDSVIYLEKPIYFTKTDKEGRFRLENLKGGTYKAVAIIDAPPGNKIFDGFQEKIGFLPTPISIPDTMLRDIHFSIFSELRPIELNKHRTNKFFFKLEFNKSPDSVSVVTNQADEFSWTKDIIQDTLIGWYQNATYPLELIVTVPNLIQDTVVIEQDTSWSSELPLKYLGPKSFNKLFIKDSVTLSFNQPISTIDTSKIFLVDSTGQQVSYYISREKLNTINIRHKFMEGAEYALQVLPNAVIGVAGLLQDSIDLKINTSLTEALGSVIVELNNLDSTKIYATYLLADENIILFKSIRYSAGATFKVEGLPPGNYDIQVIEDNNDNGKWDTGNYLENLFPEKIVNNKIENLRANWEMNVTFNWKQ